MDFMIDRGFCSRSLAQAIIKKENNFKQPGERYKSFDPTRQERFLMRIVRVLSHPKVTDEVRKTWVHYWTQADQSLGNRLAAELNLPSIQSGL